MQRQRKGDQKFEPPTEEAHRAQLLSRLAGWVSRVDEPEQIDASTYAHAREAFTAATVDHPSVVAVYGDSDTPTVAGISDLDLALVVEDRVTGLTELQDCVDEVLEEFSSIFSHGPILLPESVFERLPLLANNTMSLDHLGGRSFDPIEPDEIDLTLRTFDRLALEPYGFLVRDLYPVPEDSTSSVLPPSVVGEAKRTVEPIIASSFGQLDSVSGNLYIKKSRILSSVASVRHDWDQLCQIFGSKPQVDERVLERVDTSRQQYFDDPVTAEECLELLLDGFVCNYQIYREFVDRQRVYPRHDGTYHLRRNVPTLATPAWDSVSPYWLLERFYESRIYGRVLPSVAALHIATLPRSSDFFYGSPPDARFVDRAVADAVERRNEVLRQYFEFLERQDGWENTFKSNPTAGFIMETAKSPQATTSSAQSIKEWIRSGRNLVVTKQWERKIGEQ